MTCKPDCLANEKGKMDIQTENTRVSRNRISDAGFTLAEVMTVVAIIGFMVTMAIPNYLKMLPHLRLKAAKSDVASVIRLARSSAISNNKPSRVVFDYTKDSFTLELYDITKTPRWYDPGHVPVNSDSWVDIDLYKTTEPGSPPTDFGFNFTNEMVVFRPNGSAILSPTHAQEAVYIQNKDNPSEKFRVLVRGFTGIIEIETYSGGAWK